MLNDGDQIVSWIDAAGNSVELTNRSGVVNYHTGVINGHDVARFSGSVSLDTASNPLVDLTAVAGSTWFFVVTNVASKAFGNLVWIGSGALTDSFQMQQRASLSDSVYSRIAGSQNREGSASIVPGPYVVTLVYDGAASKLDFYRNGVLSNGGGSGSFPATLSYAGTTLIIGDSPTVTGFDGDIAEIIMYERALTTVEREEIEAYLNDKYALGF